MRILLFAILLAASGLLSARADQGPPAPEPASSETEPPPVVPGFWDPQRRSEKPALGEQRTIRFLTEGRFPPFTFTASDGALVGFDIDLARLVCEELEITCTMQTRPWDDLLPALARGEGDAVVSALAITPEARRIADFSDRYLANPARFVTRRGNPLQVATPEALEGRSVGVVAATAHEAFLDAFFKGTERVTFETRDQALAALQGEKVDAVFADAVSLSSWLNGGASECCRFVPGPYTESAFFGEGIGIAVPKGRDTLRVALDWALARLYERGLYEELYLRYFPFGLY